MSPFIGGEEGVLGNMLDPYMEGAKTDLKPSFRYIEYVDTKIWFEKGRTPRSKFIRRKLGYSPKIG